MTYPADEPGVVALGDDVYLLWDADGRGFLWHHAACRPWAALRFVPDPHSTGHTLLAGGADDLANLTVGGSLLCPMGCGRHGFVRAGRWIPA